MDIKLPRNSAELKIQSSRREGKGNWIERNLPREEEGKGVLWGTQRIANETDALISTVCQALCYAHSLSFIQLTGEKHTLVRLLGSNPSSVC